MSGRAKWWANHCYSLHRRYGDPRLGGMGGLLVKSPYGEWRPHLSSMPRPLRCGELLGHAIAEFEGKGLSRSLEWYLLYQDEDGTVVRCESGDVVESWGTYTLATTMNPVGEGPKA